MSLPEERKKHTYFDYLTEIIDRLSSQAEDLRSPWSNIHTYSFQNPVVIIKEHTYKQ